MRKSELQDGTPILCIKIDHFVKAVDFAKHLAEHFYNKNEPFNKRLKKSEAMQILKRGLFFDGLHGELDCTHYEGSFEFGEEFNPLFDESYAWVARNYPHLTPTTK